MSITMAVSATRRQIRELVDGTLEVKLHIDPSQKRDFLDTFPDIDMPVALAPLVPVAEGMQNLVDIYEKPVLDAMNDNPMTQVLNLYGQQAKELRLSAFFRRPEVWRAIGTDQEFLDWLKTQDCSAGALLCTHGGDIVPAHVRRIANGAGMGIKPEYSAIPLCNNHHSLQHQQGESAIAPREWWDKKRIEYLVKWCWLKLKADLQYESWSNVPPWVLRDWADEHDVSGHDGNMWLPSSYYDNYYEEGNV